MALSAFSDRFAMYDSTPVENLFLLEYMPFAPGDYVRVYLYGLMQCHHPDADGSLEGMARVLNMKEEQVLSAFRYWEQKGLVVGISDNPPSFEYVNVRTAMLDQKRADPGGAYQYRDFNNQLQGILGLLHPQQFQKAMEWVEDLKLPPEVVLLIVREKTDQLTEGGARKRSVPYLFKAFEQTAIAFAEQGVRTLEKAEKELSRGQPSYRLAMSVLDYLNLRRSPTTAEVDLAHKWLSEWNLDEKAVKSALKQTAASNNPSFAYLDRILQRYSRGDLEKRQQLIEIARPVLSELGVSIRVPTDDQLAAVQHFLDMGFEPDVLVRAAVRCNRSNRRSFDQLEQELTRWHALGITTSQAAEEHNKAQGELRQLAAQVFDQAGIDRKPTEADLNQLRDWLKGAPVELVMFAASIARGLKLPLRAMAKNLGDWAQKGITDVEAAKAARQTRSAPPKEDKKPQPQQDYKQRSYAPGFFDGFFANLDAEEDDR